MRIDHPAEWELAIACGIDEPGRCVFADRHYHRLDVHWRALKYVPKLDLIVGKFRPRKGEDTKPEDMAGCPPWQGLARKSSEGVIVHAARFFRDARWLAEATIIWPRRRDRRLEKQILDSVQPQDPKAEVRLWQAMGLSVTAGRSFDLHRSDSKVGRVCWEFRTAEKRGPLLSVERFAMPDVWLKLPLRDWLSEDLPPGHRIVRQDMAIYNNHRGEKLITAAKIGTVSTLRGLRRVRLDLAWQCPVENRLYRISLSKVTRDEEIPLPEHLDVRCCRPAPVIQTSQTSR